MISMQATKADIILQLQKDIFPLQGLRPVANGVAVPVGLGSMENAFPNQVFPTGAVHEFISADREHTASSSGFISGILSGLMKNGGLTIWISCCRTLFPPALKNFGIEPDRVLFIDLQKEKDVLWVMEEALKCGGLAAVVGEIADVNFTASRRLQLAVEESGVTGFILRQSPRNFNTIACISRWKISPSPSKTEDGLPGVGFPRWHVELLKIRNGKPGSWELEWAYGRFKEVYPELTLLTALQQRKTG